MISKHQAKFIKSLKLKKYRKKASSFLVEGAKSVLELVNSNFQVDLVIATEKFARAHDDTLKPLNQSLIIVSEKELGALGTLESNDQALAVAKMKAHQLPNQFADELILMLDDVRDPGNFGTIIRTADWYGINTVIASESSAEFYNPKVISSTMGSFTRVNIFYHKLEDVLGNLPGYVVYGAFLDGQSIHVLPIQKPAVIVMGNESHGVADSLKPFIQKTISIPRFGRAESLNVAISTGIILDHFRRNA